MRTCTNTTRLLSCDDVRSGKDDDDAERTLGLCPRLVQWVSWSPPAR